MQCDIDLIEKKVPKMDEIVDLTRRDSKEEFKEEIPMEVQNDCKSDGNGNDGVEENGTGIERKAGI